MALACAAAADDAPWRSLYAGADATGANVIGLWQFQPGQEGRDASGHGHDLKLRGEARYLAEGPLGGSLESFPAGTENDKPQGAAVPNDPSLSPAGAFTLELWLRGKPELEAAANVFLVDKKYYNYAKDIPEANWDYGLCLTQTGAGRKRLQAHLGYGTDSATYTSTDFAVAVGEWIHVAFTYDGAGIGRFYVNGQSAGKTVQAGRGAVTPGRYDLVLGDRYGSTHSGFPGYLAQVRLSNGIVPTFTGNLGVSAGAGRTAFYRLEKGAAVALTVSNDTGRALTGGSLRVEFGGAARTTPLPDLQPNQELPVPVPLDSALRPDSYPLKAAVSAHSEGREYRGEASFPVVIVPRPLPGRMPVVMWGGGDLPRLKELGFTHDLVWLQDYARIWAAGKPTESVDPGAVPERARMLNEYLANKMGAAVYVYPGSWVMGNEKLKAQFGRVDRAGNPRGTDNVCASFPEVQQFAYNVGASVAQTFGRFPALQASLIHSEVRDSSDLCFHPHDLEACRAATGQSVPAEVTGRYGVRYTSLPGFPTRQVVPDDHPLLRFYRWFWKDGDGWNPLHTQVHRGLKSTGRTDLWTFFDPAVRVPGVWGSGGGVDVISQWTYSYPDPLKIGQATDELFAMAGGRPGQQVMKMMQVIWYRSGTAPKLPEDESKRAAWEKEKPDAEFITIAPDHLREAFWCKLSRPIRGIMYHGWQSLVDTGSTKGYRFTNAQTQKVLAELTHTVIQPLGPTLLQVPDRRSDVGLLESFASQMFAGRGTSGWSQGWEADLHLVLQWAQLQPRILYDETIQRDGLAGFRVLVMPFCDVLTESVARQVADFQRRGGIVVADEYLTPAITPDIVLPSYKRTKQARDDKAALQALAAQLRSELDAFYTRYGESDNPDVVVRFRQYGNADYLFAVNDKRTFGDYVGHHGLVMEQGLPNQATITIRRPRGWAYDLVEHHAVPARSSGGALRIATTFGPGGGRLLLITPAPIAGVKLTVPARAQLGKSVAVGVAVVDDQGKPVAAVVPVRTDVLDPQGRPAEPSGFRTATDGRVSFTLDLARNDLPGRWTVRVTELASGKARSATIDIAR
ncbi:MAG: LamG domain-containing protein [Armatimonadetes bacterium]|nr:LamG domain-containing protein [Armatimonadota bacterium]